MTCDCDPAQLYTSKQVKTRKPHKCVECCEVINTGETATKVDSLFDGSFSTFYTCETCQELVEYIQKKGLDLCCHGELHEYLHENDLLYTDEMYEEEIEALGLPGYDPERGAIRGSSCTIAPHPYVPWLSLRRYGKWSLVEEHNEPS